MPKANRQILLASRPKAEASLDNFRLVETGLPVLGDGQMRIRNHFLSLDPYMRGRMNAVKSYAPSQALDAVMIGATAGVIVESRNPEWRVGESVVAMSGWQEFAVSDGSDLRRVDATLLPLSTYLGVAGMPGVTAWYGLHRICAPRRGETVVVSAAAGAVGGIVGQLAKRLGCRVVGIAGGAEKCRYVVEELGLDACVDYRAAGFADDLAAAAPDGIDGYFDNVGGNVLDEVMARMNPHGRIAICGSIAGYDGPRPVMRKPALILVHRLMLQGFIISEHPEQWPPALAELVPLIASGELRYRETIAHGLDAAPAAFLGLLRGHNIGKQLVELV